MLILSATGPVCRLERFGIPEESRYATKTVGFGGDLGTHQMSLHESANDDPAALLQVISTIPWFHQIDLGNGVLTPGRTSLAELNAIAQVIFDRPLTGKSVLDIGCYDGFYSFEAKRRGAARVLATDFFIWRDSRCRLAFEVARAHAGPEVEDRVIDLPDLSPETVGKFDLVLFSGVLYHLRNPFLALERIAKLVDDTLVVETHLDALSLDRPAMIFYPTTELNDDPSNWWGPNSACVVAMLRDLGFHTVDCSANPAHPHNRAIFHARR